MGWSGGAMIMSEIIEIIEDDVHPSTNKVDMFIKLITLFEEEADCDTLCECLGQSSNFDEAFNTLYPDWNEE